VSTPARVLAAGVLLLAVAAAPATATSRTAAGTPGYCPDDTGVTVVVDFTELGGDVVIRCAPGPSGTGIDALTDAGFDIEGTQRWGTAFVCRIQGRPAADEELAVKGDRGYQEQCVETPPNEAFWGYSYADNGADWTYSSQGASSHRAIEGGFEGWRFVLNGGSTDPAVAATRPGSDEPEPEPEQPQQPKPESPSTPDNPPGPGEQPDRPEQQPQPGGSGGPAPSGPTTEPTTEPTDEPAPSEQPDAESPDRGGAGGPGRPGKRQGTPDSQPDAKPKPKSDTEPAEPDATAQSDLGTTEEGATVTGELPDEPQATARQDATSPTATLVGMGLIGLLGVGAGVTAYRRRARRT